MPMVTLHKVGEGNLYHLHVLDPTDPGFGGGRPGGVDPGYGQGRPGMRPDHDLPGSGARPDHDLPGRPPHVSNRPPGSGSGGIPDHELPDTPPPQLAPGYTLVMIRGPEGKWVYAAVAPGSPPPRPLPPSSGRPDNTLPGAPEIGGGPAPTPPPRPGQPLPPTAAPKPV